MSAPALLDARPAPPGTRSRPPIKRRRPARADYVAYLLLLPLAIAGWLTAMGIGPKADVGGWQSFVYVATRLLLGWWCAHAGALLAARWYAGRALPLWRIQAIGYLIVFIPVMLLFQLHLLGLQLLFPDVATQIPHAQAALSQEYLVHLLARAVPPFLPIWMAVVHAYRKQFGVDWYATRPLDDAAADSSSPSPASISAGLVRPSFLVESRLPGDARVHTLHAAEHYIEVVTDHGNDLVRHRFNDAVREMSGLNLGCQVHRSWWVSWDGIAEVLATGRSLELRLHDGRRIPVSLTYKNGFMTRYRASGTTAGQRWPPTA